MMIALFSILFVWLGRKYKVTYYNSLLLGWVLYFVMLLVLQQYEKEQTNMVAY
jgi:amino acid permease